MIGSLLTLLSTALSLLIVDIIFQGVRIDNMVAALIAAAIIGGVNIVIKPALSALSLPINFLSFGAFALVVNGICFWLASVFAPGFVVSGLPAIILGPVILSFANTFINNYFAEKNPQLSLTTDSEGRSE